jgi:hypothetical protein
MYVYMCIYIDTDISYIFIYIHTCSFIYLCLHMYIYMYIYVYIHANYIGYSIQEALMEVPPLDRLGPTVVRTYTPNGISVMTVTFQKPLSYPLRVVSFDKSSCLNPFVNDRVKMAPSERVTFRYPVRNVPSVVLTSTSVVPRGVYHIKIQGVKLSEQGLLPSSMTLEHLSTDGRVLGRRGVPSLGVGRIVSCKN